MTEGVPKKGMSKGCLVGLIVGGVLLLLVIILAVTCYLKREDLARFAAETAVSSFKTMAANEPEIDTVYFNAVSDQFVAKLKAEPFDAEKFAAFFQNIQTVASDQKIDSVEARMVVEEMTGYFPDIKELVPAPESAASEVMSDSTMMDSAAVEETP